jgi:hypothetical protein
VHCGPIVVLVVYYPLLLHDYFVLNASIQWRARAWTRGFAAKHVPIVLKNLLLRQVSALQRVDRIILLENALSC